MSDTPAISLSLLPDQPMRDLRARAEHRLRLEARPADGLSPNESRWLVQELQVHQVELEALNEELLDTQINQFRAGMEAAAAQALYQDLFDAAPFAYLTLDAEGVLAQVNHRAAQLLGTTTARLTGRRFLQFVAPNSRVEFLRLFHHCLIQKELQGITISLLTEADISFPARLAGVTALTPAGLRLVRFTLAKASLPE